MSHLCLLFAIEEKRFVGVDEPKEPEEQGGVDVGDVDGGDHNDHENYDDHDYDINLDSKEGLMPGMLMASWAPSVQNRLGPAIDISSWNTEGDDDNGDGNDDHLDHSRDGWEVTLSDGRMEKERRSSSITTEENQVRWRGGDQGDQGGGVGGGGGRYLHPGGQWIDGLFGNHPECLLPVLWMLIVWRCKFVL